MEVVPGRGARACECLTSSIRQYLLGRIPERFAGCSLAAFEPDARRHPMQAEILEALRANPGANYFLSGSFGTGKTQFLWMLYRQAVEGRERHPLAYTLIGLLNEYRSAFDTAERRTEPARPKLTADVLRNASTKYAVFLDDIDKARPTEYVAEQVFDLLDASDDHGHQLVVTTNLPAVELIDHFERADERYGGAIVRRLLTNSTKFEMF